MGYGEGDVEGVGEEHGEVGVVSLQAERLGAVVRGEGEEEKMGRGERWTNSGKEKKVKWEGVNVWQESPVFPEAMRR